MLDGEFFKAHDLVPCSLFPVYIRRPTVERQTPERERVDTRTICKVVTCEKGQGKEPRQEERDGMGWW